MDEKQLRFSRVYRVASVTVARLSCGVEALKHTAEGPTVRYVQRNAHAAYINCRGT